MLGNTYYLFDIKMEFYNPNISLSNFDKPYIFSKVTVLDACVIICGLRVFLYIPIHYSLNLGLYI
uniref:Uncharacterized protein n=1 Tax=Physcomitrium patens TaxID=3218 RepID=A0A2K1J2E8_PHYPA|nr:hypothetical protein PHYPA_021546 [Physcomitrium patens]